MRYNLVDPVDKKQNSIPKSDISPVDLECHKGTLRLLNERTTSSHYKSTRIKGVR